MADNKQEPTVVPTPLSWDNIDKVLRDVSAQDDEIVRQVLVLIGQITKAHAKECQEQTKAAMIPEFERDVLVVVENRGQEERIRADLPKHPLREGFCTFNVKVVLGPEDRLRGHAAHDIILSHGRLLYTDVMKDSVLPILGNKDRRLFIASTRSS